MFIRFAGEVRREKEKQAKHNPAVLRVEMEKLAEETQVARCGGVSGKPTLYLPQTILEDAVQVGLTSALGAKRTNKPQVPQG